MTPEETARMDLYKNVFVSQKSLGKVLDQHGDRVVKQLKPELESIDRRLTEGYETFKNQDKRLRKVEVDVAELKATESPNPAPTPGVHGSPTRTDDQHYRVSHEELPQNPPIDSYVTEGAIKKKTAAVVAVVTGVILVTAIIIAGVIFIISKFPF